MGEKRKRKVGFWGSLLLGLALIIIPATAVMQWVSHRDPVYQMSLEWLRHTPLAAAQLGEGITSGWWVMMRRSRHTRTANVEYAVSGSRGHGEVIVSATKDDEGQWQYNYLWYRPEGGRIVALIDNLKRRTGQTAP